jgi:hypothetical protein
MRQRISSGRRLLEKAVLRHDGPLRRSQLGQLGYLALAVIVDLDELVDREVGRRLRHVVGDFGNEDAMFPGVDGAGRATGHQIASGELTLRDMLNETI